MKLLGATGSHVGNVREANQDRVYFRGLVAALADGMGGHQGGERAAELAITEFQEAGQHLSEGDLVEVVLQANRQVHGHAADNGLPGMGTTVVAMTLHDDNTITVANVGDSRAYWLRGDYMGQVTEDHSFVEDLVRQGRLTAEEAATHPQRNILTRAVGIGAEVEVDRFPIPEPEVGDRFLLCSDGLFNELSEDEILDILLDAGDPADTAATLIEATLRTPCRDNVTVAVVDLVADDDPRVAVQAADEESSKVITAPIPVVSKSVLHDPKPIGRGNGTSDASATPQSQTGTLLLAEAEEQTSDEDPELYVETAELNLTDDLEPTSVEPRSRLVMGLGVVALVAALAVGGFFLARNYARSGVFIADDTSGQLAIFEGRRGGFLGFDPVRVIGTDFSRQTLDSTQQAMVEQDFESLEAAEAVVAQISDELAVVQSLDSSDGNSQSGNADEPEEGSQIGQSPEADEKTSTTQLNQPSQSASTSGN